MANPIIKTWALLYERLSRQSYHKLSNSRIIYKDKNGKITYLKLVYNDTGSQWWFEEEAK